jgi:hypothetical protein
MRPLRNKSLFLLLLLLAFTALAAFAAGCGDDEETDVSEGEALVLDGMTYDIQDTRALNPYSPEDSAYLEGVAPLKHGQEYLAVFMKIDNKGDEPNVVPQPFRIIDTRGTIYDQVPVDNDFSLEPGTPVLPDESLPGPETIAANGPIKGSMILFVIDQDANENRPLLLQVPGGPDGVGTIELDL